MRRKSLGSKINSKLDVAGLLSGVYVANDLAEAYQMQKDLMDQESVVTKEGVWLLLPLRVNRANDAKAGVIARKKELAALRQSLSS